MHTFTDLLNTVSWSSVLDFVMYNMTAQSIKQYRKYGEALR